MGRKEKPSAPKLKKPRKPSQKVLKNCFDYLHNNKDKLYQGLLSKSDIAYIVFDYYPMLFTLKQISNLALVYKQIQIFSFYEVKLLPSNPEPRKVCILVGPLDKIKVLIDIYRYFEDGLVLYIKYRYNLHKKQKRKGLRNPGNFKSIESQIKKKALTDFISYTKEWLEYGRKTFIVAPKAKGRNKSL